MKSTWGQSVGPSKVRDQEVGGSNPLRPDQIPQSPPTVSAQKDFRL